MIKLARMMDDFEPSPISEIFTLCSKLKDQGQEIIDLSIGEPDFDTPEHIKEAGIKAINDGNTKYTPVVGAMALRSAICRKFGRDNGIDYTPDQILVESGLKPLLFRALEALVDIGDEVLIPAPTWVSYTGMVALVGGKSVLVPCLAENSFKLQPEDLDRAITDKTKVVFLNSPSNPTGAAYTRDELRALAGVLLKYPHVAIFSDDIYEHIVYDDFEFTTLACVEPRLFEQVLTFNGVSKAYSMTGWRIGYMGGPSRIIDAIRNVMSQNTGNPCSISQLAAIAALDGPQDVLSERAAIFKERRDLLSSGLGSIPGITPNKPEGAFYLYPSIEGLLSKTTPDGNIINSSNDVALYLMKEAGVAVVPGSGFKFDPHIRFSYATSAEALKSAVKQIGDAVSRLS